jgi:hypothetical protein
VCPANLAFQWQRELRDKFDEQFEVLKGPDLREQYGINQWLERTQVVTSLDLAKHWQEGETCKECPQRELKKSHHIPLL